MAGQIDIHEVFALAGELQRAPLEARLKVSQAIVSTAYSIRETAQGLAPRVTGALADSIEATGPQGGTLRTGSLSAAIGPTVFYGRFVEDGTSQVGPRPYMAPAADANEPALLAAIALAGWAAI